MALTIDKKTTALLVMDCENDIVHKEGKIAMGMGFGAMVEKYGTLKHIRTVLDAAREVKIPIIYIEVDMSKLKPEEFPHRGQFFANLAASAGQTLVKGTWGAQIHDDVKPEPGEYVIGKCIVSSFCRSTLDETLKKHGVTDIILTGVATTMVVEATARDAVDRGYSCITVENAVTSFSDEAHSGSMAVLRMISDVGSAAEVAAALKA